MDIMNYRKLTRFVIKKQFIQSETVKHGKFWPEEKKPFEFRVPDSNFNLCHFIKSITVFFLKGSGGLKLIIFSCNSTGCVSGKSKTIFLACNSRNSLPLSVLNQARLFKKNPSLISFQNSISGYFLNNSTASLISRPQFILSG